MGREPVRSELLVTVVPAGVTSAAWAGWLGWDERYDVQADGSLSGPYEAWQVIGLVLTLLGLVCWVASRNRVAAAVVGTTSGLAVAAYVDWSDDGSGLFLIGVAMIVIGSVVASTLVSLLVAAVARKAGGRRRG
ncbi:hypothetical protein ACWCPM_33760 [Streptomyces sp. NPDC002309]